MTFRNEEMDVTTQNSSKRNKTSVWRLCLGKMALLLLAFSSVLSNTGTLILAIIIMFETSWIYILIIFCFNFCICYFIKPTSYVRFMEKRFDVTFRWDEEEDNKIQQGLP